LTSWSEPVGNGATEPGRPRVSNYPVYSSSAGIEAVQLAASVGLYLDPWQQYILRHALGERPDGRWSAFEVGLIVSRQNGKGSVLEALELAGLLLFGSKLILHTAHELKTAMEHKRRIESLFANSDDLRKRVKRVVNSNGDEGIEFKNGARLRFVARSRGSGRGFSGDLIVLDEAFALTPEQVGALMPTLSARPNPQIWYTSSPPLDPVTGAQLFTVRRRGQAIDPGRLAWFDYGNPGQLDQLRDPRCVGTIHVAGCSCVDLDDPERLASANPALTAHRPTALSREFCSQERAAMDDVSYARERLGIWPADLLDANRIISADDWKAAEDLESRRDGRPVFAAAVSLDRSRSAIAAVGLRADGRRHMELVDLRPGTGWVIRRLIELRDQWKPYATIMDPFGPTGSLVSAAEESGLKVETIGTSDVAKAYGLFYDSFAGTDPASRNVRHIGQTELTAAVAGAVRRQLGEGFAWDRRNASTDITPLVAATNALYGFSVYGHKQPVKPWVAYA
jgi:hypothetical protein